MSDDTTTYEAPPGLNEWEKEMLAIAERDGVLAACRESYVDGMNWEQKYGKEVRQRRDAVDRASEALLLHHMDCNLGFHLDRERVVRAVLDAVEETRG